METALDHSVHSTSDVLAGFLVLAAQPGATPSAESVALTDGSTECVLAIHRRYIVAGSVSSMLSHSLLSACRVPDMNSRPQAWAPDLARRLYSSLRQSALAHRLRQGEPVRECA